MLGSLEHPGVMVNTLHDMFMRMKTDEKFAEAKFKVTLSYMEIYNEVRRLISRDCGWCCVRLPCSDPL